MNLYNHCPHQWRRVHEQSIIGGSFPVGWECLKCNIYVNDSELTPAGLPGTVTKQHRLTGINGMPVVETNSGRRCCGQMYDEESGELTYL